MEEALKCSFCSERFSDSIKLIPECGNSICGRCCQYLTHDADEESKKYKCSACKKEHILLQSGLPDNINLLKLLQSLPEKPMPENAKTLKIEAKKVETQLEKLHSFDAKQVIESHCEQFEQQVGEAIESAINHLKDIEKNLMIQIREFREKYLEKLSDPPSELLEKVQQELTELTKEVDGFNTRWNEYFRRIEIYATESDINAALVQSAQFISKMDSIEEKMRKEALNWQMLVFKENSQFLKDWNHAGEIKIAAESKTIQQKPVFHAAQFNFRRFNTSLAKIEIDETPRLTLTGHPERVRQVLFLANGRLASCSGKEPIQIWDVENGKELFELRGHTDYVLSMALLPNGHLATGLEDDTIKIWNLEKKRTIRTIRAHSDAVVSLQVLKNGNLASYSRDDTIKIWNLNSKEDKPVSTLNGHGNSTLFSLFGILSNDHLVTCSCDSNFEKECILRVWKANESNPIRSVSTNLKDVCSFLVLSNGQVALGCESGTIKTIDLGDDTLSRTKERAHDKDVYTLAQLSKGTLISAGQDSMNFSIKLWNLKDWSLLQTIKTGHSELIRSLSVCVDGSVLASGSRDHTIMIWSVY